MLIGKTQWLVISTFWHKMSDLKPVCSIKIRKLSEKSHFCALSVISLRLLCILKLEGLLQGYVKWKNTMTGNVNFMTQNVGPWTCYTQIYMGKLTEKSHFCALSDIYLRLVCILMLEGLLQCYVNWNQQWRVMSISDTKCRIWNQFAPLKCGNWPKNHIFVASPLYL